MTRLRHAKFRAIARCKRRARDRLQPSIGYDRVVGQLLRYVNWVRQNLAEKGQRVRGIIVCRTMSEDLKLACASIRDVELFEYQLSVTVSKVPSVLLQDE